MWGLAIITNATTHAATTKTTARTRKTQWKMRGRRLLTDAIGTPLVLSTIDIFIEFR
jgi:hypothetical protein